MTTPWYESAFDRLYPILYRHRSSEEARRTVLAFRDRLRGNEPVLDLACGAGRHLKALDALGVGASVGTDLSGFLLATAAKDESLVGRTVQSDMRCLPFREGAFGAVINMFTSFGYFSSDTDNQSVLREVARVLRSGGLLLIDYLNAVRVRAHLVAHNEREAGAYRVRERRTLMNNDRDLVKVIEVESDRQASFRLEERLRLYCRDEMESMMREAGLKPIDAFGDYDANPFDETASERLILMARCV